MKGVKRWDAIIIGAGIIGVSLAIELDKRGLRVLVVEKGEPGQEASWAAGGMLADFPLEMPVALRELATASARMYPEFVHELEDESRMRIDLRDQGTLLFADPANLVAPHDSSLAALRGNSCTFPKPLLELEAHLAPDNIARLTGLFLQERSVDPRHLTAAAIAAAKHREIDFSSGNHVLAVEVEDGRAAGVRTNRSQFAAGIVVNCAGAWAGEIGSEVSGGSGAALVQAERGSGGFLPLPTRPVKGQMLRVAMPEKELVRHVIRTPDVYLIPRSDGRMLIGATQEESGFDKQTIPQTIQKLRREALDLVPKLAEARFLEAWAGLRPGTPDALPILGATETRGYYVATGHFRDGILLAPVTARVMGQVIAGENPGFDLTAFGTARFRN